MSDPVCSLFPQPEPNACYADDFVFEQQPVCSSQPEDPTLSQPFNSDTKCYAKKSDFIAEYKANLEATRERAYGLTARMFAPHAPVVAARPKVEKSDFIGDMWSGIGNYASEAEGAEKLYKYPLTGIAAVGGGIITVVGGVFGMAGCAPHEDTVEQPEIPDATPPPSNTDKVCDDRVALIQGLPSKDSSLDSLVSGLTLPTLNIIPGIIVDYPAGNYVNTITPTQSDIVGYQISGNNVVILLNPKTTGDNVAPGIILVYKKEGSTLTPITTNEAIVNSGSSNALLLPYFKPTNFAKVSDSEIDIMYDALANRGPAEIDPATGQPIPQLPLISMFNPQTLSFGNLDWCTDKAMGDGGSGFGDGGGGDGGSKVDGGGGAGGDAGSKDGGAGGG